MESPTNGEPHDFGPFPGELRIGTEGKGPQPRGMKIIFFEDGMHSVLIERLLRGERAPAPP